MIGESQLYLQDLAEQFNESQDQVRVEVRSQGTDYPEVLRKYTAGVPSGELPDLVYMEVGSLRQIVDSGTVVAAEDCERADGFDPGQLPAVRQRYTADSTYWPVYTNVGEPVLYYNANHFRRADLDPADPPATLAELRTTAEALKAAGIETPLALVLSPSFVEAWVNGAGEDVVDGGNGNDELARGATFDNAATHELYAWVDAMAADGLLQGYSATEGQLDHYLAVAQQSSSMVIETSIASTTIKAVLGGDDVGVGTADDLDTIDIAAGPFPGLDAAGRVPVGGAGFFLSNAGSDAEQAGAWAFAKFMWEVESQVGWHLRGSYLPTTQAAAQDPAVASYWSDDVAGRMLKVGYDELLEIDPDRPGPQVGPFSDYREAVRTSLDALVLGDSTVDEAVAAAQADIDEAVADYAADR
jgi:sn-glycerol 3-phosphate transport system substrate-binding protein